MELTKIIFDADMLLFQVLNQAETTIEWEPNFFTLHLDLNEAIVAFDERVKELLEVLFNHWNDIGVYQIYMCISSTEDYFRKDLLPEYKANRQNKRKPVCYLQMREWLKKNYRTIEYPKLEADDCCGILATSPTDIVVSGDKDFRSIPSRLYDFSRNEFVESTLESANRHHLLQTLVGDSTDNYKGCPGIGAVRAERILNEQGATWDTVVSTFEKQGSTEEEALLNARLAYILRSENYNKKTGEITPWKPLTTTHHT